MVRRECERLKMERADFRFSRRDVRTYTGWGDTQLRVHLHRLEELEYLLVHRGGRGQSFVYELLFERQGENRPVLPGLIDVEKLAGYSYEGKNAGRNGEIAAPSRRQNGGIAASARSVPETITAGLSNDFPAIPPEITDNGLGEDSTVVVAMER
jgi:hypothetical protein